MTEPGFDGQTVELDENGQGVVTLADGQRYQVTVTATAEVIPGKHRQEEEEK